MCMPLGAEAVYYSICEEERRENRQQLFVDREMEDAHNEAICAFYTGTTLTTKGAAALAKLWAHMADEYGMDDPDVERVAKELDLSAKDMHAILGHQAELEEIILDAHYDRY